MGSLAKPLTQAQKIKIKNIKIMVEKLTDEEITDYEFQIKAEKAEKRQAIVEQNGNDGLNYEEKEDRKAMPIFTGVLKYFPDALKEVSKCSLAGQKQHNQGDKLYWDKDKSTDNSDALVRHLIDHEVSPIDDDGVLHLAKVAWRALATLQIYLDNNNNK